MIGIGHRQEKYTKIKLLAEKAKQHNEKFDQLLQTGTHPTDAVKQLQQEQYDLRHEVAHEEEPYNISHKINPLNGAVNLGYHEAHKTLTETQTLYAPMQSVMEAKKTGTASGFKTTKTAEQLASESNIRERIQKDHLQEDAEVDFGEKKVSDYKRHFVDDDRMKQQREGKDKQFNQRKNDLKWYADTYVKTKDSLRKC